MQDLIVGGTDTSSVIVEWAMSELLRKPDVLAKVTDEHHPLIYSSFATAFGHTGV